MIKTTQEIENYIFPLSKLLNLENEPKWVILRFMANISLSLNEGFEELEVSLYDGRDYRLEQITGKDKIDEDYTKLYQDMIEAFNNISISNTKELEDNLQQHIIRGYTILKTSLKHDSNIFEFIGQEFFNK
ncbi:DndE family protein [Halarcobacter sp.]|uniref:DndE family protein n=1 Tax=Halarcobacter sp. TaxID=2321133 RepID=UPI003A8F7364